MTTTRYRLSAAVAATALPLLVVLVARLAWGPDLPETVARHWSADGPDGFSDTGTFFAVVIAVCAIVTVVAVVSAVRGRGDAALWLPTTALISWITAATWIAGVTATRQAGAPEAASLGWAIVIPLLGIPWAVAVYAIAPKSTNVRRYGPAPTLSVPLSEDERAVWTGYARGPWAAVLGLIMVVAAVVAGLLGAPWLVLLFVLVALASGVFASIGVQVDRTGLTLSSWGVQWRRIPLDAISEAQVARIRPAEWGGFGYRVSPRGTAVIVHGGDGLVLTRQDGRQFAVTVDSPAIGAALLNSLITAPQR
ncbi:hypothetical protein [Rhodococcus sp. NPDC049939]|uniref:hypothetical protein n=1 Tax=Rhodococcus sp. NPDC049939 TaxID=3155511 RepID=UPI0033E8415A